MLPSGQLTSKNDENGSYLQSSIKKPATKNLLGKNLLVRPPLNNNLFSLKFETGSYFLKSIKKKSCTIRYLVSQRSGFSMKPYHSNSLVPNITPMQFNGMQMLYNIFYYNE